MHAVTTAATAPAISADLLKAKLAAEPLATRARQALGRGEALTRDAIAVVVADMVERLDEGRIERGFGDIADLSRAGYDPDLAWKLGPVAARELARRIAKAEIEASGERDDMREVA